MRVTDIDHIVLNCADVEKELAWWRDELGLAPLRVDEWRRKEVPFVSVRVNDGTIIDLFEAARSGENLNHVAIYIGGGQVVHAPSTGDVVKISNISDWGTSYVGARRI